MISNEWRLFLESLSPGHKAFLLDRAPALVAAIRAANDDEILDVIDEAASLLRGQQRQETLDDAMPLVGGNPV